MGRIFQNTETQRSGRVWRRRRVNGTHRRKDDRGDRHHRGRQKSSRACPGSSSSRSRTIVSPRLVPGVALSRFLHCFSNSLMRTSMGKGRKPPKDWLARKSRRGFRGYPIASVAFYGPTADLATRAVVAIARDERNIPDPLERWFPEDTDVRSHLDVGEKIVVRNTPPSPSSSPTASSAALTKKASTTLMENHARSVPSGPDAIASVSSASTEPRTPRRYTFFRSLPPFFVCKSTVFFLAALQRWIRASVFSTVVPME
jgi:hypothetical protein